MTDAVLKDVISGLEGLLDRLSRISATMPPVPPEMPPVPLETRIAEFIDGQLQRIDGGMVIFREFYSEFRRFLPNAERRDCTERRVKIAMEPLEVVNESYRNNYRRVIRGLLWQGDSLPALPEPAPAPDPATPPPLERFLAEQCFEVPGESILFSEFFERFKLWLESEEIEKRSDWTSKMKVIKALPHNFPYGIRHSNQRYVGNISWERGPAQGSPLILYRGKLKPRQDP